MLTASIICSGVGDLPAFAHLILTKLYEGGASTSLFHGQTEVKSFFRAGHLGFNPEQSGSNCQCGPLQSYGTGIPGGGAWGVTVSSPQVVLLHL